MAALSTVEKCCHWMREHELEYRVLLAYGVLRSSLAVILTSSLGAIQRLSFSKYLKKRSLGHPKGRGRVEPSCPTPQPAARPADDSDSDFDIYWYWQRLTFRVLDYRVLQPGSSVVEYKVTPRLHSSVTILHNVDEHLRLSINVQKMNSNTR